MKKAFATMLILAMLLSALAAAEAADLTGMWYLIAIQSDGKSISPADYGMSMTLELEDGGVARVISSMDDETSEGTWEANGDTVTVTVGDSPLAFTLADGKLTADDSGMVLIFSQEEPEMDTFAPSAPVVEDSEANFAGKWLAEKIGMEGQFYPISILGTDVTASIEGTAVTLDGFMFSNTVFLLEFADGKLSLSGTDEESGLNMSVTATLLEDGMLALDLDAGAQGAFTFYMSRVEGEAEVPAA